MNTSTKASEILASTTFENKVLVPKDGTEFRLFSKEYHVGGDFANAEARTETTLRYSSIYSGWQLIHNYYGTSDLPPVGREFIKLVDFMEKHPGSFWPLAKHEVRSNYALMLLQKGVQGPDADGNVYIVTKLTPK